MQRRGAGLSWLGARRTLWPAFCLGLDVGDCGAFPPRPLRVVEPTTAATRFIVASTRQRSSAASSLDSGGPRCFPREAALPGTGMTAENAWSMRSSSVCTRSCESTAGLWPRRPACVGREPCPLAGSLAGTSLPLDGKGGGWRAPPCSAGVDAAPLSRVTSRPASGPEAPDNGGDAAGGAASTDALPLPGLPRSRGDKRGALAA